MPVPRLDALLAAVLAASAAVQPTSAQRDTATQTPPAFKVATDLVQVDVMVHDKTGWFVADLRPDDFIVREEGEPQAVRFFSLVGEPRQSDASIDTRSAQPADVASPVPRAQPAAVAALRIFVVVFDDDHLTAGGFKRVQAAAAALFSKEFRAGDIGGVVVDGAMIDNRLTSDRDDLLKAIGKAKPNARTASRLFDEREWPRLNEAEAVRITDANDQEILNAAIGRACTEDPTSCQKLDVRSMLLEKSGRMSRATRVSTDQTLQSLAALFAGLGRMDGRKSVLLLTEGFITQTSWPLVQRATGLAAAANARLYTLDARGLDRGMSDRLSGSDPGQFNEFAAILEQWDLGGDAMNSLAADTGGFVVRNTNQFDRAVAQIARDAGTYYVLGYVPAKAPDGTFRRIAVTVKRPGVTVRARRGYMATPHPVVSPTASPAAPSVPDAPPAAAMMGSATAPPAAPPSDLPPAGAPSPAGSEPVTPVPAALVPTGLARARPDAVKHADALAVAAPVDEEASRGWDAYQRGDLESAQVSLAAAAAHPGARPWVRYALGQADYALGHFDRAVNSWETVRTDAPDFEPVYFDLVDACLQLKDYDRATRVLRAASERWPHDPEVFSALGVVQVARGTLDDGLKSFEKAVAIAPQDGTAHFNLAKTYELRYYKSRRWVALTHTWVANDQDRKYAIENYQQTVNLGGPFVAAARQGLERLDWQGK